MMSKTQWSVFVPEESAAAGCRISMGCDDTSSGKAAVRMSSDAIARFGITPKQEIFPVKRGESYRISAWVKAGAHLQLKANSPGVLLRATLFSDRDTNFSGGHFYAGLKGTSLGDPTSLATEKVPTEWSKIDAVFEIPEDVTYARFHVFCWWTKGSVCIRDALLERVENTN